MTALENFTAYLFPILLPLGGAIFLMLIAPGPHSLVEQLPSRLCHAAFTFDIWALTALLSKQRVRFYSLVEPKFEFVLLILILHLIFLAACTRQSASNLPPRWLFAVNYSIGIFAIGLTIPIRT